MTSNPSKRRKIVKKFVDEKKQIIRLGFPSISTKFAEFPIDIAADIGCEVIKEFLRLHRGLDFELVMIEQDSKVLNAFELKWKEIKDDLDAFKFQTKNGNLLQLKSDFGIECRFIVAETTWRMKPGTNQLNKQIFDAVGSRLHEELKRLYPNPGVVGEAYPVQIPKDSDLHIDEGIEQIIFVVSPNMNPSRPDPVSLGKAKELLKKTYHSMLNAFWELKIGQEYRPITTKKEKGSAFDILMKSASKSSFKTSAESSKRILPKVGGKGWTNVLLPYCQSPETFPKSEVYYYDDELVIIYDKYPKAKKHLLVIPRKYIDNIEELKKQDLQLVRALKEKGQCVIEKMKQENPKLFFRMGFHAVPGLRQLHMHVISQDFISPSLKHKKHWNSFTTEFFKDAEEIEKILEERGEIKFNKEYYENLLKSPLKCHLCDTKSIKFIPDLKKHLEEHWNES
ncbi:HIT-like domain-containing protein [Glomus cerebriforme]|uniref:HIT-like domain-containing protein n=1 Tax=Glomus cerebriforme TaxID=658196 RepID=A0A397T307_9GLOM|nr:HIT-like domain-containing protein [Glomus cerebriforme]